MVRVGRAGTAVLLAIALVSALAIAGCNSAPTAATQPKVGPPVIKHTGVLRAGVDLGYPPFAGTDNGEQAGIDVDVASAIAGRLGLKVQLVDVKAAGIATALASGDVDVALSAPFSADVLARATVAGTYVSDGPVLFARKGDPSAPTTSAVMALDGTKVAAQQDSEAYWVLVGELGPDGVIAYPTLRQAFDALGRHEVASVAGDALVGAYMARDQADVRYVGPLGPAHLLGVAVAANNTRLADAVRSTLDGLSSDGALDAIRAAWVGALPKLPLASAEQSETLPGVAATPSAPAASSLPTTP